MRQSLFLLLSFFLLSTQAQTIQKTGLESPILKWENSYNKISTVYSDEQNYYFTYSTSVMTSLVSANVAVDFFVIDKKLTAIKSYPVILEKEHFYVETFVTKNHILIFLTHYDKKQKERYLIKQTYSKETGELLQQETIAKISIEPKRHVARLKSTISPDGSKLGFVYMIIETNFKVDGFLAIVFDEEGEMQWKSYQKSVGSSSNEKSSLMDVAVSNDACLYFASHSYPDKKSPNRTHYLDLVSLSDKGKEKSTISFNDQEAISMKIKILKNGNAYVAALLRDKTENKKLSMASILINPKSLDAEHVFTEQFAPNPVIVDNYGTEIVDIIELNDKKTTVICEQKLTTVYQTPYYSTYTRRRGTVVAFSIAPNAEIEQTCFLEKYQMNQVSRQIEANEMHISISPCVYKDQLILLYNDNVESKKSSADIKKLEDDGKNVSIMMAIQKDDDNMEKLSLTGNTPANRLLREVLFVEKDYFVVLTRTNTMAYIEKIIMD